jgi:hypothetical protein
MTTTERPIDQSDQFVVGGSNLQVPRTPDPAVAELWSGLFLRGGSPILPESLERWYSPATQALFKELRALGEQKAIADKTRVELDAKLHTAPNEHARALAVAARKDIKKLPMDPTPALKQERAVALDRSAGLAGAAREVGLELARAVDDEMEKATAKALRAARTKLAAVLPDLEAAVAEMAEVDTAYSQVTWTSNPTTTFREGTARDVSQHLQAAVKSARRLTPKEG